MSKQIDNFGEAYQKLSKDGFDATVHSFGEVNKGFQAIAAEVTDYSKEVFDDGMRAWEQRLGVKSFDQAIRIQSEYAKTAYDKHIAEFSKLSEMYAGMARSAYRPVEDAVAGKVA
jgi:hypothetical protein